MQKIAFFINSLGSGGAEHQLLELAKGLQQRGYDVSITTYSDVEDFYDVPTEIKRNRIAPHKSNFIKFLFIWRYYSRIKTDWVICFGRRANFLGILPLFFNSRIKVIAGERCATIGDLPLKDSIISRFVYKRANYIVPNSFAQGHQIVNWFPEFESKLKVITNYTDLDFYKMTSSPNEEVIKIGVFGRYDEQKNCLRFVEAVKLLNSISHKKFVIEWFGNKSFKDNRPNHYYELMKAKVEECSINDILILNGHTKSVVKEMSRFDAISLPSLYEGFSNSISEAICCGKPCIVSDVADNGVMVHNGVNGFLFNPLSVEDMADAFIKFFSLTEKEKRNMEIASRKRAEELFDRTTFIDSYVKLIESN